MYVCEPVEKRVLVIFGALYQALFLMVSMCVTLALVPFVATLPLMQCLNT